MKVVFGVYLMGHAPRTILLGPITGRLVTFSRSFKAATPPDICSSRREGTTPSACTRPRPSLRCYDHAVPIILPKFMRMKHDIHCSLYNNNNNNGSSISSGGGGGDDDHHAQQQKQQQVLQQEAYPAIWPLLTPTVRPSLALSPPK